MIKKKTSLRKSDIIYHVIKGWRIILLFTLIGMIAGIALVGIGYIRGEMTREYRITTSVAVVAQDKDGKFTARGNTPYKTDVDFARDLTEDAIYIIKSESNLKRVVDKAGLKNISPGSIAGNLSLTQYAETEIIEMSLLWRSEKEGLKIMDTINKVSDASMLSVLKIGRISVINEPKANFIIGGNVSISSWFLAAFGGFAFGVIFILLRFVLSTTVINGSDLETIFGVDLLAEMPFDKKYAVSKPPLGEDVKMRDNINSLTHMLINRMEQEKIHRLYITSTCHKEGRTGLLANVGLQLAALGKKTLLIDCDLRNPQLGALFASDLLYEQTLNALYRGDSDKIDAVLRINGCLDLLPVVLEKVPENFNDAMLDALNRVMEGYDYVLIDAAPVGEDAEVLRLNEICDAVIFVARCDDTLVDSMRKSLRRLEKSGIPIIGAVFNFATSWKDAFKRTKKQMEKLENIVNETTSRDARRKKKKKASEEENN